MHLLGAVKSFAASMHLSTVAKSSVGAGATTFLAGQAIAPEHVQFVTLLAGAVGVVIGAVTWIDKRIKGQVSDHNDKDQLRHAITISRIDALEAKLNKLVGLA